VTTPAKRPSSPKGKAQPTPAPTPAPVARTRASASTPARCTHATKTGRPCRAAVRPGGKFCALHDPALEGARMAARRRAAATTNAPRRRRTLPAGTATPDLGNSRDVVGYLSQLVGRVERGEIDVRVGNCVGQIVNVLLRALSQVETVERIAAIERAVAALPADQAAGVADELARVRAASESRQ